MSQTQETEQEQEKNQSQNQQNQPHVERAEEVINRAGRNIGLFAGLAGLRIKQVATAIPREWQRAAKPVLAPNEKAEQPEVAGAEESAKIAGEKATEQAEQVVDQAAKKLGIFATALSYQAQKAAARLREEGEDILFEAQHLRQQNVQQDTQQQNSNQQNTHQQNEQK